MEEGIATSFIECCITGILGITNTEQEVVGIVGHDGTAKLYNIVQIVALIDRAGLQIKCVFLAEQLVGSIDEHLATGLGVDTASTSKSCSPRTGLKSLQVGACRPYILYGTLYGIGTIVERTLAEQAPRFLHHAVVDSIACYRILGHPLSHIGLCTHPGELVDEVVADGSLLDSLGRSTDTLDIVILCFISKVVVCHILQAAHQSRATTEVGDNAEYGILRSIAIVAIVIKIRITIREKVEYNQFTSRNTLKRQSLIVTPPLPLLDYPLRTGFGSLHCIVDCCISLYRCEVTGTFVEGVHRVVLALAHYLLQTSIVVSSNASKTCVTRFNNMRTSESSPSARIDC